MPLKPNSLTELQLIEGCKKKDAKCQKLLFERFAPKMIGLCKRYARHNMEAEDMVQDGFIKVFKYLKSYKGNGSFEGWVRKIIINTALKHCAKSSFKKEAIGVTNYPETPYNPAVFSKLEIDELYKLIAELPTGYKTIFNLYVIDGYSHQEIAKMLNIGESTSRSQLVKARRILQSKVIELSKIAV